MNGIEYLHSVTLIDHFIYLFISSFTWWHKILILIHANICYVKSLGPNKQEGVRSTSNSWRSGSLTDDDSGWKFSGRGSKSMRALSGSGNWRNNYSGMDYNRLIKYNIMKL